MGSLCSLKPSRQRATAGCSSKVFPQPQTKELHERIHRSPCRHSRPQLARCSCPGLRRRPSGPVRLPGGGVVKDNQTGLYWQQATAPMTYTFDDAVAYCSGNAAALPGAGWRLPAIKELQTLVDDSVAPPGPTIDASAFPATPANVFWSSTPYAPSASSIGLIVSFIDGNTRETVMTYMASVRCVR